MRGRFINTPSVSFSVSMFTLANAFRRSGSQSRIMSSSSKRCPILAHIDTLMTRLSWRITVVERLENSPLCEFQLRSSTSKTVASLASKMTGINNQISGEPARHACLAKSSHSLHRGRKKHLEFSLLTAGIAVIFFLKVCTLSGLVALLVAVQLQTASGIGGFQTFRLIDLNPKLVQARKITSDETVLSSRKNV